MVRRGVALCAMVGFGCQQCQMFLWRVAVSLVGTLLAIQGHIKLIAANGVAFLPLCLFLGSYRWSLFCAIECFWKMSCWLICEIVR